MRIRWILFRLEQVIADNNEKIELNIDVILQTRDKNRIVINEEKQNPWDLD